MNNVLVNVHTRINLKLERNNFLVLTTFELLQNNFSKFQSKNFCDRKECWHISVHNNVWFVVQQILELPVLNSRRTFGAAPFLPPMFIYRVIVVRVFVACKWHNYGTTFGVWSSARQSISCKHPHVQPKMLHYNMNTEHEPPQNPSH